MDPQKLAQLDPKLREAYQRVMGTPIPPMPTPQPKPEPAQPPVSEPHPAPSIPKPIAEPEPQPAINPQPQTIPTQPASNFVQMSSEVASTPATASPNFTVPAPQTQTIVLKKKNGMLPVLFVIVALIFIAIYTLFWVKIFNLRLPFLP